MSELEKFPLHYEYDQTHTEIKKLFRSIRKHNKSILAEIKKKAKAGQQLNEIARQYNMTVQKVTSIVRSKK